MHITFFCRFWLAMTPLLLLAPALCGCRSGEEAKASRAVSKTPASGIFRDVADEAGLRFRWGHNGKSPLDIRDTTGGGGGFLDFDRDGLLDVLLVGDTVALYRNRGNGTFTDVSAQSGLSVRGHLMGCAVGDFDNDGFSDVFITGHGVTKLYRNTRKKRPIFQDVTDAAGVGRRGPYDWPTSAGFVDLDADGFLDLAVCRYVLFTPQTPQFCEMTNPAGKPIPAACPPYYYEPQKLLVYRNQGNGRYEDMSDRFPERHGNSLGIAFADFDDDGKMDIYVANDGEPGDLYHNRGGWKFQNLGTASATAYNQDGREQAGMGVDWSDYDGDGRLDLIVATYLQEPRSLYRNEGDGLFSYASFNALIGEVTKTSLAFGVVLTDFDNDAHPDLIFTNGHVQSNIAAINPSTSYRQPMHLFRNQGDGTFANAANEGGAVFQRPIVGRGIALGDYDNDGRMDALVVDLEGAPLLLHNEDKSSHHWLGVRVLNKAGRDAVGARITLERESGGKRVAEAQTCRGYLSASDPRIHFGLGKSDRVTRLMVRWPSGKITAVKNPPTDRYLTVKEEAR